MGHMERTSMAKVGYARPVALALTRPTLTVAALRLVIEALRSFFLPQFENVLFRRRPVVNVDHPLDACVPFDPGYSKKYLEFVKLWIGSFYSIWRLYGRQSIPGLASYVDSIGALYAEAGRVYRKAHTTTTRPSANYNLRFALIHATDPHLNCIPSLHVLVVTGNWMLAESLVGSMPPLPGFDAQAWIDSLRGEALAITESVLFMKQHSVNCVGASLYCLRRFFPRFEGERADAFVRDLFAEGRGAPRSLDPELAERLRCRMREIRDDLEGAYAAHPDRGWRPPIMRFIMSYAD
jgi:hypothetical protein